ncbi:type II toxin-antitoxin system Phd/YefM family antitoxin [Aerococcus loyolae]|uniref:Antitoxin n=1 Tax=Aerococcus loyolae TaxID=2976809 RepID=A0ABT4BXD9_9LACT|nr:type II toxin-antitoxin system Phd/YefM family antitoxin [Aerococcus loyolae]MCY3024929.1 type II toxin-antitoxin system Phd/YefM family antitoxin [Aerococcus loyolae]MCY3027015.1 type II toxin-antitoxin system Phd/YefM family antitoxin [Aerococcus loyolae]MCY3028599.1 type II toxin-antitoxin system Phd/YefM family antitoxin [Aerococcus loyolae]
MDHVNKNAFEYTVTLQNGNDVLVMAKSDFDSLMETYHLLSSRANRENLYKAMDELDRGDYEVEKI